MVDEQHNIKSLYDSCSRWYETVEGQYILEQINPKIKDYLSHTFGYYAYETGPLVDHQHFLDESLIGTRFSIGHNMQDTNVHAKPEALPLAANSIDLVIASHIFECSMQPHQALREIDRVLVADGECVFIGFNPLSLLFSHRSLRSAVNTSPHSKLYGVRQIQDWLTLLNWKVNKISYLGFRPAFLKGKLYHRSEIMENWGQLYWPILGKLYIIHAKKESYSQTPIKSQARTVFPSRAAGVAINPIPRSQQSRDQK
ncbi:MAG: methyltransferase domain-containing protein [Thiotrichaceae bacterium]|nr:methyltransferase domain-containing protein [Thiotrichaceae bacterium]